jgi:hypothetical protein
MPSLILPQLAASGAVGGYCLLLLARRVQHLTTCRPNHGCGTIFGVQNQSFMLF